MSAQDLEEEGVSRRRFLQHLLVGGGVVAAAGAEKLQKQIEEESKRLGVALRKLSAWLDARAQEQMLEKVITYKEKLLGRQPLEKDEKQVGRIKVVQSGVDFIEALSVKNVNVRVLPLSQNSRSSETPVLFEIPVGTVIESSISVLGFRPSSPEKGTWYGFLVRDIQEQVTNLDPMQPGFIFEDYIKEIPSSK